VTELCETSLTFATSFNTKTPHEDGFPWGGLQKRRFRESLPLRMPKLHRRILKKLKPSLTAPDGTRTAHMKLAWPWQTLDEALASRLSESSGKRKRTPP
jgi:hypothetical protein